MASTAVSAPSGTYPLRLDSDLFAENGSETSSQNELSAFRYAFKPGSVADVPGYLTNHASGSKEMTFDIVNGGQQVFDVREEASKTRECVLVFEDQTQGYTLRMLPTTYHLTLNRNASSVTRPNTGTSQISSASTNSSASIPLSAQRKQFQGGDVFEDNTPRPSKKPRPSTKADPEEHFPFAASPLTTPKTTKGRGKTGAKKATTKRPTKAGKVKGKAAKAPPVPEGKFKSAEIIEDSDEEYDLSEAGVEPSTAAEEGDGEDDEFARMIGESLAEPDEQPLPGPLPRRGYEDEDESDESGEESDEEELGGATLIGRAGAAMNNGESEWL